MTRFWTRRDSGSEFPELRCSPAFSLIPESYAETPEN
jgi:hypothetical protein